MMLLDVWETIMMLLDVWHCVSGTVCSGCLNAGR